MHQFTVLIIPIPSPVILIYTGTVTASKQAVSAMASNSSCVFTGQADRKIKIWRVNL